MFGRSLIIIFRIFAAKISATERSFCLFSLAVNRSTIKTKYPATIDTKGKQALYDNLGKDETLALRVHETIKANARDGFRDMDSRSSFFQFFDEFFY